MWAFLWIIGAGYLFLGRIHVEEKSKAAGVVGRGHVAGGDDANSSTVSLIDILV